MNKILMQGQLDMLAHEMGCRLDQLGIDTPGMMYVEFGYVEGPILTNDYTYSAPNIECRYLVNLHELGHFAYDHTQGRPPMSEEKWYFENGVLRSEAEAWDWALDNSLIKEYAPETSAYMWEKCMGSYYRSSVGNKATNNRLGNGNRHHVEFAWDEPDDYFWSVQERMYNGDSATAKSKIPLRGLSAVR